MKRVLLLLLIVIKAESDAGSRQMRLRFEPCKTNKIKTYYSYGSHASGEENQYVIHVIWVRVIDEVVIEFLSEANVELVYQNRMNPSDVAIISASSNNTIFTIKVLARFDDLDFTVRGVNGKVPYFYRFIINGEEQCRNSEVGYLDSLVRHTRLARQVRSQTLDSECGKRKVDYTPLIVNGVVTTPGDWPWHVAVYRRLLYTRTYICGGTLISKLFVLTAAHCASIGKSPVSPDALGIVLGKHHLKADDVLSEWREVSAVKIHADFRSPDRIDNDIALLKLKTEAEYTDYVQPACLWSNNTNTRMSSTNQIIGSVVGWGNTDNTLVISPDLKHASMPMLSNEKCIRSNFIFYGSVLQNNKKFCAGWGNGTSPCNGDSGSGFLVNVPDGSSTGAWHIRGIVSMTLKTSNTLMCDPTKYVVFTDVSKYTEWIKITILESNTQG